MRHLDRHVQMAQTSQPVEVVQLAEQHRIHPHIDVDLESLECVRKVRRRGEGEAAEVESTVPGCADDQHAQVRHRGQKPTEMRIGRPRRHGEFGASRAFDEGVDDRLHVGRRGIREDPMQTDHLQRRDAAKEGENLRVGAVTRDREVDLLERQSRECITTRRRAR